MSINGHLIIGAFIGIVASSSGPVSALQSIDPRGANPATIPSDDPIAVKCKGQVRLGCRPASRLYASEPLPAFVLDPEPVPTDTLARALEAAYRTAPTLQAQRYQLRAANEDYAQALSELRPTTSAEVEGDLSRTIDGRYTQSQKLFSPSNVATSRTLIGSASVTQPLYTGGRATADRDAALAGVRAGRAQLRGAEGDLLLQVIAAYVGVRTDAEILRFRVANLKQLTATLDEVKARREAGELTLTDVGLAETQLDLAQSQYNVATSQLLQDRATFAALVGRDAGVLAEAPPLPNIPTSIDDAFAIAEKQSPDLAQAIETERRSYARIASAKAQGQPTVSLNGAATLTGPAPPYYLRNDDQAYEARLVLTIPLTNGGRVGSLTAQAADRNAADRAGIEAARRQVVMSIVDAWNALATAQRNIEMGRRQVAAAKIYDEGTFEEYRAGLRSTFDVLYSHAALRDAEIALTQSNSDLFLAQATLLRRIGLLEARSLLTGYGPYDPDLDFKAASRRAALPWDGAIRAIDRLGATRPRQPGLRQPPLGSSEPAMVSADPDQAAGPPIPYATTSPDVPIPGTVGTPAPERSLKRP